MIVTDQQERLSAWLCERSGVDVPPPLVCIGEIINDRIVGVVGFAEYNGASIQMHLAGALTRNLLHVGFDYPFNQCRVKVLLGYVGSGNEKSIRLAKHAGFRIEHVLKDAHPSGDLIIFAMRPGECWTPNRGTRHAENKQSTASS